MNTVSRKRYEIEIQLLTVVDNSKIVRPLIEPRGLRWPWVTYKSHCSRFKVADGQKQKKYIIIIIIYW